MIIGVTGTDGAGKGTLVDYLVSKKGFAHYSLREEIVKEIRQQGLPETRSQMRLTGNEMRKREGNGVLVVRALADIKEAGIKDAAIESIRALAEAKALKEAGGILLAIDADPKVRYERVQARRSSSDQVSFEEFLTQEALERNDPDPHGMQKTAVMKGATHTFFNNGSIDELNTAIEDFFKTDGV